MMSAEPQFTSSNLSTQRWSRRELLLRGGGGLLAAGLIAGCQGAAPPAAESPTVSPTAPTAPATPTAATRGRHQAGAFPGAQPAAPSLEQMLAQMVMVGFRGTTLASAAPIVADISERGVGSVVLFTYDVGLQSPTRNVESPEQLATVDGRPAGLNAQFRAPCRAAAPADRRRPGRRAGGAPEREARFPAHHVGAGAGRHAAIPPSPTRRPKPWPRRWRRRASTTISPPSSTSTATRPTRSSAPWAAASPPTPP